MKIRGCVFHFEALEARQLRSADSPAPTDGTDLHLLINPSGNTVVSKSPDRMARKPLPEFKWYDGTLHRAITGNGGSAFENAICDGWYMWPSGPDGEKIRGGEADEGWTRRLARDAVGWGTKLVILDNEAWGFDIRYSSPAVVEDTMRRMKQVLGWIRDEEPQLKIGIYGYMSQSDDNNSFTWPRGSVRSSLGDEWYATHLPDYSNKFAGWQATSEFLRPLSSSVDYVFPALYTGTTDPAGWEETARITIEDSRRFGKPVIPFIWPYYHPGLGAPLGHTEIPTEFWERQLDLVREYADGGYVWNGFPTASDAAWLATTIARTTPVQSMPSAPLPMFAATSDGDDKTTERRGFFSDAPLDDVLLAA